MLPPAAAALPPPPAPGLGRFFATALAWLVLLTAGWLAVAPWTSHPAALLAKAGLEAGAAGWIIEVRARPGQIEAETRVQVAAPGQPAGTRADLVLQSDPARYAYSLPIFWALVVAARSRGWAWRAALGPLALLPGQAFSVAFDLLRQVVAAGSTALQAPQWQVEAVILAYQFGALVVPTLLPVMLWLWTDRAFFARVVAPRFAAPLAPPEEEGANGASGS